MDDPETLARERQARLDDELVPLPVAATVAYFHVTDAAHQVDGLKIRRGDLRRAMITLREARAAFGPAR